MTFLHLLLRNIPEVVMVCTDEGAACIIFKLVLACCCSREIVNRFVFCRNEGRLIGQ